MKKDPKQERVYKAFVKHLDKNIVIEKKRYQLSVSNVDTAISFWNELSYADKKRLVSSSRWNHYPSQSWTYGSKKPYGEAIGHLVANRISLNSRDRSILMKNSVGVFAVYAFDDAEASEKISMSKRLFKSVDKRLRLRSVDFSEYSFLKSALPCAIKLEDYNLVNKIVSRVGIVNCYKSFIPNDASSPRLVKLSWWTTKALSLASRDEVCHLDDAINLSPIERSILIKKMPVEKALFYISSENQGERVAAVIRRKLESI
jgi:hypothetical protein